MKTKMKTITELIEESQSDSPTPAGSYADEVEEIHAINLIMSYNGGSRRGRKSLKEIHSFQTELRLRVSYKKVYLYFD